MKPRPLGPAQRELGVAIAWYKAQAPGLGDAFLIEGLRIPRLIERHPQALQPLSANTRRCRLSRFPYGVIYSEGAEELLAIAIGHLHRQPEYWRDRRGDLRS